MLAREALSYILKLKEKGSARAVKKYSPLAPDCTVKHPAGAAWICILTALTRLEEPRAPRVWFLQEIRGATDAGPGSVVRLSLLRLPAPHSTWCCCRYCSWGREGENPRCSGQSELADKPCREDGGGRSLKKDTSGLIQKKWEYWNSKQILLLIA